MPFHYYLIAREYLEVPSFLNDTFSEFRANTIEVTPLEYPSQKEPKELYWYFTAYIELFKKVVLVQVKKYEDKNHLDVK